MKEQSDQELSSKEQLRRERISAAMVIENARRKQLKALLLAGPSSTVTNKQA